MNEKHSEKDEIILKKKDNISPHFANLSGPVGEETVADITGVEEIYVVDNPVTKERSKQRIQKAILNDKRRQVNVYFFNTNKGLIRTIFSALKDFFKKET